MTALGRHLLLELNDCNSQRLDDLDLVRRLMLRAAHEVGATIIGHSFHRFQPHGISGVVVIAESHLSIHTWPEHAYAAADIFSCSASFRPEAAARILADGLESARPSIMVVERGMVPQPSFQPMLKEALPGQRA